MHWCTVLSYNVLVIDERGEIAGTQEEGIYLGKFADVLSFSDKYQGGKRQFPADIDEKIAKKIQSVTKKVYQALNFNGVIRIDYFVQGGTVYLNEINSVPGSLANYLFGESMADFTRLINQLIETGVSKNSKRQTLNTKFNSGILTGLSPKGSKRLH